MPDRYSITECTPEQIRRVGVDVRTTRNLRIIFATLTKEQVASLRALGCKVNKVGRVKVAVMPPTPVPTGEVWYSPEEIVRVAGLDQFRSLSKPPLFGQGVNLAILDTGIRESHELIGGRVVYSENFSSAADCDDVFDHGSAVAALALTLAPQCNILNMKVMNDDGEGSEEEVALAIDAAISIYDEQAGVVPLVMNLSLGAPDEGNPDSALRVACRAAIEKGIWIAAAAGNSGPEPGTILCPACERYVGAIGSVSYEPFVISKFSSRGPTKEGITKPDLVFFGENILVASSSSDTATVIKSGTSFSTPFGSGLGVLYLEGLYKGAVPTTAIRGVGEIGGVVLDIMQEALDIYLPRLCIKPEGVSAMKDCDYGCGLPFGPLALQAFQAIQVVGVLSAIPAMIITIMMATMIPKLIKV